MRVPSVTAKEMRAICLLPCALLTSLVVSACTTTGDTASQVAQADENSDLSILTEWRFRKEGTLEAQNHTVVYDPARTPRANVARRASGFCDSRLRLTSIKDGPPPKERPTYRVLIVQCR